MNESITVVKDCSVSRTDDWRADMSIATKGQKGFIVSESPNTLTVQLIGFTYEYVIPKDCVKKGNWKLIEAWEEEK